MRSSRRDGHALVFLALAALLFIVAAILLSGRFSSRDEAVKGGYLSQQIEAAVVLTGAVLAALQYVWVARREAQFKADERAQEFIARYNAPEFNLQKSKASQAYQRWVRNKNPEDIRRLQSLVEMPASQMEDATDGLFAIFGVLNFFEEVAVAYFNDEVDETLLREYFRPAALDTNYNYRSFLATMPSFWPRFRRLCGEWTDDGRV